MLHDDGCTSRRELLKRGTLGLGFGLFGLGMVSRLFLEEAYGIVPDAGLQKYDACIQIFYKGGPSQTDTFDPKPGSPNNIFPTINLGARDIYGNPVYLTDRFPNIANVVMNDPAIGLGIVRSMAHGNADHNSGEEWMSCFWQSPVATQYPSTAAAMSYLFQQQVAGGVEIPAVVIPYFNQWQANTGKGGPCPTALFMGPDDAKKLLDLPNSNPARYARRKQFMDAVAGPYLATRPDNEARAWTAACDRAYKVTTSGKASAAFDLTGKPILPGGPTADAGDLRRFTLAQELVKAGIPYVQMNVEGNDTHKLNLATITQNWGDTTDPALAKMAQNLKATGKRVLIVMGGEFGRGAADAVGGHDGREHDADGFSWAFLSINQPAFKTTAVGNTGPDGVWHTYSKTNPLVDPIAPGALGGLIYRSLGFPVGSGSQWDVPTVIGMRPPVDAGMATSTARGNAIWLQQQFGLA